MKRDNRLKIGVDMDGVLSNFIAKYREICMSIVGRELPVESLDWNQSNWGLTKEEHNKAWEIIGKTSHFYTKLPVLDDVDPFKLYELERATNTFYITTRPPTAGLPIETQTAMWLERKLASYYPTVLVASNKGPISKALGLYAFIDDKPENLLDIHEASPETKLYLNDQPWNKEYSHPEMQRVKNYNEFVDIILEKNERNSN